MEVKTIQTKRDFEYEFLYFIIWIDILIRGYIYILYV